LIYDTVPPTCTVTGPASPTNASPIGFTINFSKSVSGLTSAGITVTNGVMLYLKGKANVSISGSVNVTLSPPDPAFDNYPGVDLYSGVSIFQARDNTNSDQISGSDSVTIDGILYCPAASVGASGSARQFGTLLICNTFAISGSGTAILK